MACAEFLRVILASDGLIDAADMPQYKTYQAVRPLDKLEINRPEGLRTLLLNSIGSESAKRGATSASRYQRRRSGVCQTTQARADF